MTTEQELSQEMEQKRIMQDAQDLAVAVAKLLKQKYDLLVEPEVRMVQKTNVEKVGIMMTPVNTGDLRMSDKVQIAPTFYPDNYADMSYDEKVEAIARAVKSSMEYRPELPELTVEQAKQHITLTLVNAAHNQEILDKTPHFSVADGELAAIPRWYLEENASFIVNNQITASMGLTPDEVLQIGQQNINNQRFETQSMQEVLMAMMPPEMMEQMPPEMLFPAGSPDMIVMSNENKLQGANVLLSQKTLDDLHERIGPYAIIPSSIHEVIALPITDEISPQQMREMVQEVNGTQVAPEERLSDQIMMYNGQKLSLVGDTFKPEMEKQAVKMDTMKFAM